jgi:hypothetical protein
MEKQTFIDQLVAWDNSRARSKQTAIGVSSLGDCKRKVWHMARGDAGTNTTLRLPAIMGTAIHAMIEQAVHNTGVLIEYRVEIDGYPPATIDYYNPATGEVVDWKTITLKNVDYFVTKQKRWQIQTYAYLLMQLKDPAIDVKTVTLVGIPRDGTENDIEIYSEPYDPAVAEEALAWLANIRTLEDAPEPEREPASFCQRYCQFYGTLCSGKTADMSGAPITDENAERAAKAYVEISAKLKELKAEQDSAKTALEGIAGITMDGIKVSWSSINGRSTPDLDQVKTLLGDQPIPMKTGEPSVRLNVK